MSNIYRHGDVLIKQVAKMPKGAKKVFTGKNYVVAEGEATGHNHRLATVEVDTEFEIYELNGQKYLKLSGTSTITHEEHKPLTILPGIYVVGDEREWDYFSNEVQQVRD